jgi:polar amino acid transport system permease protein
VYKFDFAPVFASFGHLLDGAAVTMELSCGAMLIGLVISILCAAAKTSRIAPLVWIVNVYVEVIRNTPFLIQIFFIYFGLPAAGISFNPNTAALVALTVNVGAYGTEIIRAGIESIQRGQIEAGIALGLKPVQIFRYVILKPALRTVYPALTSQFIFLMLTSSVVSVISATDLAAAGNDVQSETFASFEVYLVVTAMYLVMSSVLSVFFSAIQRMAFRYPLSR